nr:hypothetical protein [Kutzneria sp. CA-103260]
MREMSSCRAGPPTPLPIMAGRAATACGPDLEGQQINLVAGSCREALFVDVPQFRQGKPQGTRGSSGGCRETVNVDLSMMSAAVL